MTWVDPRASPRPPAPKPRWKPVEDPEEIGELLTFCRTGRIYEIERWIMAGKPLQATKYEVYRRGRLDSPLEIAIGKDLYDVALLLLCNGYQMEAESNPYGTPLDFALGRRSWDIVELLLEWGADMRSVDPESVFGTYRVDLMDRFWDAGLGFADRHALAWHLAEHSSNRPLYGWTRRHRDDPRIARELNIALLQAVDNKREKVVHLLLWAGADPRAPVPMLEWISETGEEDEDLYTPIEHATSFGRGAFLPILKPDPARDDFAALYATADNVDVLKYLVRIQVPKDWSPAILHNLYRLDSPFGSDGAKACLDFIASKDGRLGQLTPEDCGNVRRCLLKLSESEFRDLLSWLSDPGCCEPATYAEITRTPSMKSRLRRARSEAERRRRGW